MTEFASTTWDGDLDVSTPFGQTDELHRTPHAGVDIITPGPCYAPFAGTVRRSIAAGDSGNGFGNYFELLSDDGRFVFIIGHCNDNSDLGLRSGDHVSIRQALVGSYGEPSTGYSTGPHYHEQLEDNGVPVNLLDYLGSRYEGGSTEPVSGWQVGQTDFTGTYGENALNGAAWYCIEPATDNSKTIAAIAAAHGLDLGTVNAWTQKVAASKWGGPLLQAGSSWWDGSDNYYAGVCIALNDVAAQLDAYEAAQVAQQAADAAATQAALAAAKATPGGATDHGVTPTGTTPNNPKPMPIPDPWTPPTLPAPLPQGSVDADPNAPLSGLLADKPGTRKKAYYAYAIAALVVSFGPDIITAGILTHAQIDTFAAVLGLTTSIILKIGVAFGFVAASNVKN